MKIGIGGIYHETHTFPSKKTTFEDFSRSLYARNDIISSFNNTKTSIGGFIEYASKNDIEIMPCFYCSATPSGMIAKEAFEEMIRMFNENLSGCDEFDGFLLAQHGAMCVEGYEDAEGYLISMIKDRIGGGPLVVTTDFHANISEKMTSSCNCIVGYDTYPHIDIFERGFDACKIIKNIILKKEKISNAFLSLPLLGVPQAITTEIGVMKDAMNMVYAFEKEEDIINITLAGGFVYSDIKSAGISIIVSFKNNKDKAKKIAEKIGRFIWENRKKMIANNADVKTAVKMALDSDKYPVVLVDVADNIGGGTPGEGTVLLEELIKNKMSGSVVCICDKAAVEKCIKAGIGNNISIEVGGKSDDFYGKALKISVYVKMINDGEFINTGKNMTGLKTKMGKSVLVVIDGIKLILNEFPTAPNDPNMLCSMGIDLKREKYLVVKGAIAWKTGLDIDPGKIIFVDTPGLTSADLGSFNFKNIRRPIFPFDDFEIDFDEMIKIYS